MVVDSGQGAEWMARCGEKSYSAMQYRTVGKTVLRAHICGEEN